MPVQVIAVDHPELPPYAMPDRFRHDVIYFVSTLPADSPHAHLPEREYWIGTADAQEIYDCGVIRIVSPLDSDSRTELEISEEQELWLQWMIDNNVQHIRLK